MRIEVWEKKPKSQSNLGQIMPLRLCSFLIVDPVLVSGTVDRNKYNLRSPDSSEAAFVMR